MPEQTVSATDGLVGMMNVFVDPGTTARKATSRLAWLWPVLVLCIGYGIFAYLMQPFSTQLIDAKMAERNLSPEQLERAQSMTHTFTKIGSVMTPVLIIGFMALLALLVKVAYSMMDIRTRFRDVFSFMAACSLIPMLQYMASYIVLRSKGDPITSQEQITPPFGLDIFFQNAKGAFLTLLNFFSIFQIWYLVVLVIGLAVLTRSSKSKALFAITPAWLLPLLFRLVGAMFSR